MYQIIEIFWYCVWGWKAAKGRYNVVRKIWGQKFNWKLCTLRKRMIIQFGHSCGPMKYWWFGYRRLAHCGNSRRITASWLSNFKFRYFLILLHLENIVILFFCVCHSICIMHYVYTLVFVICMALIIFIPVGNSSFIELMLYGRFLLSQ